MNPDVFIAEVYRRMALRHASRADRPNWEQVQNDPVVIKATHQYASHLPKAKDGAILDVGFGGGWFLAACLKLGYNHLSGADFNIHNKENVKAWAPDSIALYQIEGNIGTFLSDKREHYDFIHLSHVIEHIPKYSLFWVVDALYYAPRPGGKLLLRTPNMEGPCANSSLYVTLSHEYGFAGSNLSSLLDICGFRRRPLPHIQRAFNHAEATRRCDASMAVSESQSTPSPAVWFELGWTIWRRTRRDSHARRLATLF